MGDFHRMNNNGEVIVRIVRILLVSAQRYNQTIREEDNFWLIASVVSLVSIWAFLLV